MPRPCAVVFTFTTTKTPCSNPECHGLAPWSLRSLLQKHPAQTPYATALRRGLYVHYYKNTLLKPRMPRPCAVVFTFTATKTPCSNPECHGLAPWFVTFTAGFDSSGLHVSC